MQTAYFGSRNDYYLFHFVSNYVQSILFLPPKYIFTALSMWLLDLTFTFVWTSEYCILKDFRYSRSHSMSGWFLGKPQCFLHIFKWPWTVTGHLLSSGNVGIEVDCLIGVPQYIMEQRNAWISWINPKKVSSMKTAVFYKDSRNRRGLCCVLIPFHVLSVCLG